MGHPKGMPFTNSAQTDRPDFGIKGFESFHRTLLLCIPGGYLNNKPSRRLYFALIGESETLCHDYQVVLCVQLGEN